MEQYNLQVEGMSCTGCEERVVNAVKQVESIHRVNADHEKGTVEVTADEDNSDAAKRAIHDAGYDIPS